MNDVTSTVVSMRPFIPAKDFELSKRFYLDLGFKIAFDSQDLTEMRIEPYSFLLQNFYEEGWAKNCMMHMIVKDVDAWWNLISSLKLVEKYGVQAPADPKIQPWGLKVGFLHDPSGVLWHIAEKPSATV